MSDEETKRSLVEFICRRMTEMMDLLNTADTPFKRELAIRTVLRWTQSYRGMLVDEDLREEVVPLIETVEAKIFGLHLIAAKELM